MADSPSRSGAFESAVDKRVEQFTESISFDSRLFREDIAGSIAHANMLADQELVTPDERDQIVQCLTEIGQELESGKFPLRRELEDIHMNIEQALIDRLGDVGRKLHTGRSRNDQVSTDMRLWIRASIDRMDELLAGLQTSFIRLAQQEGDVVIPAYTHLQRAQPILAAHYFMAYCEKLERDRQRLQDCRTRVNQSSLGTAAVAGTSLDIDRENTAGQLQFDGLLQNSLDSSSDRDYMIEFVFCLSLISIHLSSWAEDWILWSTTEFNLIKIPQEFCTGSSIMPQKINPDVLELTRGKAARVIGDLQTLLVLVKALPMAYNRDLQEDKPALFDAFDTTEACLSLAIPLVEGSRLRRESIRAGLERGFLDATTLMEFFIKRGIPQRTAHHAVGQLVRQAMQQNCHLADLSLKDFQAFDPSLDRSIYDVLGVENAISNFRSTGSTCPEQVSRQLARWCERLELN
ncbi:MAG: argininosuccinate lyase [Planctomycetota bacterium]|nr:argininosuccinate lyase [Planctomycetota bacterium]